MQRVAGTQPDVEKQDREQKRGNKDAQSATERQQDRHRDQRIGNRKFAARERPEPLLRMMPVGFQIEQVVEQIAARSAATERHERQQRLFDQRHVAELMGGKQGRQNQQILEPMRGSQCPQTVCQGGFLIRKNPVDLGHPRRL